MKKILFWLVFIFVVTTYSWTAETKPQNTNEKIDSIYVWQKEMYRTHKNEPLIEKRYGVEFNFLRLILFGSDLNGINRTLSGGFSLFYPKKNVEIAFPLLYSDPQGENFEGYESHRRKITLDCQYRKYLGNTLNKFYLTALARYANTKHFYEDHESSTNNAFGIGVGIGYRNISYSGVYWGTNLCIGRYLLGSVRTRDILFGSTGESEFLFSMSLFKFGYAF